MKKLILLLMFAAIASGCQLESTDDQGNSPLIGKWITDACIKGEENKLIYWARGIYDFNDDGKIVPGLRYFRNDSCTGDFSYDKAGFIINVVTVSNAWKDVLIDVTITVGNEEKYEDILKEIKPIVESETAEQAEEFIANEERLERHYELQFIVDSAIEVDPELEEINPIIQGRLEEELGIEAATYTEASENLKTAIEEELKYFSDLDIEPDPTVYRTRAGKVVARTNIYTDNYVVPQVKTETISKRIFMVFDDQGETTLEEGIKGNKIKITVPAEIPKMLQGYYTISSGSLCFSDNINYASFKWSLKPRDPTSIDFESCLTRLGSE